MLSCSNNLYSKRGKERTSLAFGQLNVENDK